MSDSENERNLNDSNIISFDQRMRDFYERQTRNMQQNRRMDNMVNDMIGSNSNLFSQPSNPTPKKKRRYYERNREEGHMRLFKDYFHDNPVYPDHLYRRRFRIRKPLFLRLVEAVSVNDTFFQAGPNGSGREEGRAPEVNYYVNGNRYNMGYYLTDGIYPSWASFVKSISTPVIQKHKLFAQHQEAVRKDVERAFGVLQAPFAFIKKPSLVWDPNLMDKIIMACIIMHNMIVEDERVTYLNQYDTPDFEGEDLDDDT
ncbi:uncharacterized protein LOC141640824 [Silene latifolia]|uniref:uncharacterized protein LOC141640824 n=1 Tax=Silene latifolia TaxID=37657 RepID=UPI003D78A2A6